MCLSCKLNQELEWKFESVIRVQCMQGKCLKVLFIYRMYYHSWLCWSRSTDGSLYVGWWKVCCFQNLFIALFCLVHSVSTQYLVRNRTGFLLELCFVSDVFLFHTSGFNLISGVSNHNQHKLLLKFHLVLILPRVPIKIFIFITYQKAIWNPAAVSVSYSCIFSTFVLFYHLVYAFPRQIWVCSSAYWTPVKANHSSGRNVNFSVTYVLHENYNVEVLIHPQRQEFKISSSWKCVNFHVYTLSNEFIYKLGLNPEHGDTTVIRFC